MMMNNIQTSSKPKCGNALARILKVVGLLSLHFAVVESASRRTSFGTAKYGRMFPIRYMKSDRCTIKEMIISSQQCTGSAKEGNQCEFAERGCRLDRVQDLFIQYNPTCADCPNKAVAAVWPFGISVCQQCAGVWRRIDAFQSKQTRTRVIDRNQEHGDSWHDKNWRNLLIDLKGNNYVNNYLEFNKNHPTFPLVSDRLTKISTNGARLRWFKQKYLLQVYRDTSYETLRSTTFPLFRTSDMLEPVQISGWTKAPEIDTSLEHAQQYSKIKLDSEKSKSIGMAKMLVTISSDAGRVKCNKKATMATNLKNESGELLLKYGEPVTIQRIKQTNKFSKSSIKVRCDRTQKELFVKKNHLSFKKEVSFGELIGEIGPHRREERNVLQFYTPITKRAGAFCTLAHQRQQQNRGVEFEITEGEVNMINKVQNDPNALYLTVISKKHQKKTKAYIIRCDNPKDMKALELFAERLIRRKPVVTVEKYRESQVVDIGPRERHPYPTLRGTRTQTPPRRRLCTSQLVIQKLMDEIRAAQAADRS